MCARTAYVCMILPRRAVPCRHGADTIQLHASRRGRHRTLAALPILPYTARACALGLALPSLQGEGGASQADPPRGAGDMAALSSSL